MNPRLSRLVSATALGALIATLLVTLLTIVGEEWAPLKNWLKATFFHHWLGKSYLSVGAFLLVTLIAYPFTARCSPVRSVWMVSGVALIASIVLTLYFILHTLHFV